MHDNELNFHIERKVSDVLRSELGAQKTSREAQGQQRAIALTFHVLNAGNDLPDEFVSR